VNYLCGKLDFFISIRKLTAHRFKRWAGIKDATDYYLPNCIDESQYGAAPKRADLLAKFGLEGKKVVMTTGRMDSNGFDSRKGFDEVLEVLPELRRHVPDIAYLIVGDGGEKQRLGQKAKELGVADIVRFSGYVSDAEKADYYRLADVFAMPGSNPIFDRYPFRFVFLEALACGVPVVGSRLEDESEMNDADAKALIIQVDPNDKADIIRGIFEAFSCCGKGVNPVMKEYYCPAFRDRLHGYLRRIVGGNTA
jgi:glycosyltransferase involved in cell wall biosynthesis